MFLSRFIPSVLLSCVVGGCAWLPSTGPDASDVESQAQDRHVAVETVTPEMAETLWRQQTDVERQRVQKALDGLAQSNRASEVTLHPGDTLNVAMWTQPLWGSLSGDISATAAPVQKSDFGNFTVGNDGTITLPYAGKVSVAGKTQSAAQRYLSDRYSGMGRFQAPQIILTMGENPQQQVIVTGAANHPSVFNWRDGGLDLSHAITRAGGYIVYQEGQNTALSANRVVVVRGGVGYDLPIKVALETATPLSPGDRVVLEHRPAVSVLCLGGGWPQSTTENFDELPTLTKVMASGGGLNSQTAQGKAVYILTSDRQVIYKFLWDSLDGIQAAQKFPVQNGDVVYVAAAPSVRLQQITNILFGAAYPVGTAKAVY